MTKTILIAVIIIFGWSALHGQQNPFNQFKIDHWDTKRGIPNNLIEVLYQSKDGFIWIDGNFGLARFDGVGFKIFNSRNVPEMKTDEIGSPLTETNDSTLWIATPNSGLLAYKNGGFTAYMQEYSALVLTAKSKNEELLFYTTSEKNPYVLFNTHTKKHTDVGDSLLQVMLLSGEIFYPNRVDKSGDQWLIISDKLRRISKGKVFDLNREEVVVKNMHVNNHLREFYHRGVHGVYVDSQNRVWDGTEKGLMLLNGKSFALFPGMEHTVFYQYPSTTSVILEDSKGGIWAKVGSGLAYLPPQASRFVFPPQNHPLHNLFARNIMEDREGNIWAATEKGLYKLSYSKFVNYSRVDGLPDTRLTGVYALDSNRYIVAAQEYKLFLIDHGQVHPYIFKNKTADVNSFGVLKLLQDSRGTIWSCSQLGLLKITPTGEKFYRIQKQVSYAFEDVDKKIWFGVVGAGIGYLNESDSLVFLNFPQIDFKSMSISLIRKLKNGSWCVGLYGNGILLIDASGQPTYIQAIDGMKFSVYGSYEAPEGSLWLATSMGIARYKDGLLSNISSQEGLPVQGVLDFLPDDSGGVWLPTNKGLLRIKLLDLSAYLDKKINKINWTLYDEGDGMISREGGGWSGHSAISPDGKILVPTLAGLVVVTPTTLDINTISPPVIIHHVARDNDVITHTSNLSFEPGNHRYFFEYSGLSFVAPEKVQIKFKLEGYDSDWITNVGDRKASYTNIPPGHYTFRVMASNNDGVWNETGASFSFTVSPFFYETTGFRMLVISTLLLLMWVIIKWRTKAIKNHNDLLEAQVTSRTNELNKANIELNQSNASVVIQRDSLEKTLSNLKSTQAQLIQSEKMASLGELTAGIAHEIQNPLNFVNNFSEVNKELLLEMKEAAEKGNLAEIKTIANDVISNQEKINHHGKRADAIVKGMLQHSRSSSGQKEPTDVNALTDEYLRLAYHGLRAKDKSFNVTMKTDFDEHVRTIDVVRQDIGRVILNLITNAFYAVTVRKKQEGNDFEPAVFVGTKKIGDKILISIKDNGNGIPESIRQKIFQPFFTTKPTGHGTGLGLSLSFDIVKAHGGTLTVETKEQEGSDFIVTLPTNT